MNFSFLMKIVKHVIKMIRSLLVFLKYDGSIKEFFGREFYKDGDILFAGNNIQQLGGDDRTKWDEILYIRYFDMEKYNDDIKRLAKENKIKIYKVLLTTPFSRFNMFKSRMRMKLNNLIYTPSKDDEKDIDKKDRKKWKKTVSAGSTPNYDQLSEFLKRDRSKRIQMLNLLKFRDHALYPKGYKGKQLTGDRAYSIYGRIANRCLKRLRCFLELAGSIDSIVAGNEDSDWDFVGFVHYRSMNSLVKYTSSKVFQDVQIHREAGMEKTKIYAIFPYEEFL